MDLSFPRSRTFWFVLGLLAWLAVTGATAEESGAPRVDAHLTQALAGAPPGERLAVGVVLAGGEALPAPGPARRKEVSALQDLVLAALPDGAFEITRRYRSLAGFAGRANAEALTALARHPGVTRVYLDGRVYARLAEGRGLIHANDVHAQGYTGAGVRVAVLDSGIDSDHPHLVDDLVAQHCFCQGLVLGCCPDGTNEDDSAEDDAGHGTSVAGIITSGGVGAPLGVAPDAEIVAVKVLGSGGSGSFSDVDAALDWVLSNHAALGIRVVNMSLGDGGEYANASGSPCGSSNTANAISDLHATGIAVFAASGNDGHDQGISFPACVAAAISVGGVYDANVGSVSWCGEDPLCVTTQCTDATTAPDMFVCHTNSGSLLDLLAPDYRTQTSAMGGGVETSFGGTSAASPYAAAEAALLLDADPSLAPEEIRSLLAASGPLVTNPGNGQSYRRADVGEAVEALPEPDAVLALVAGDGTLAVLARRRLRGSSIRLLS